MVLIVFACILLNGCALKQPSSEFDKNAFRSLPEKYKEKALEYEKKGQIREALLSWWIVNSFVPYDRKVEEKIKSLKKTVRQRGEDHFQKGQGFYEKGAFNDARREFLATLTYEPEHKQALDYLLNKIQQPVFSTYLVQEGDTLRSVAMKTYQDPGGDSLITAFNKVGSKGALTAGTSLKIVIMDANFPDKINFHEMAGIDDTRLLEPRRQKSKVIASVQPQKTMDDAANPAQEKKDELPQDALKYRQAKELLDKEEHLESLVILRTIDKGFRDVQRLIASTEVFLQQEADAHYRKGISYFLSEDLDKAIMEWNEVIRLSPNHLKAKKDLRNARRLQQKMKKF